MVCAWVTQKSYAESSHDYPLNGEFKQHFDKSWEIRWGIKSLDRIKELNQQCPWSNLLYIASIVSCKKQKNPPCQGRNNKRHLCLFLLYDFHLSCISVGKACFERAYGEVEPPRTVIFVHQLFGWIMRRESLADQKNLSDKNIKTCETWQVWAKIESQEHFLKTLHWIWSKEVQHELLCV